jgi:two-component system response regulator YesN
VKRVLVVDDEQPVVDHIVRIIERELPDEFVVAGTASSGRQTLEIAPALDAHILVMDVRMPGLSGLDTIRELRRRGLEPAVVLSTAYERFDIVREALELGVAGYLLKPVARDALVRTLRLAASRLDRDSGIAPSEDAAALTADALVLGIMAGRHDQRALLARLGITKPWALVGAADFRHGTEADRDALELALQYKSQALCGPMASGRCAVFLPLSSADEAGEAEARLTEAVKTAFGDDFHSGRVRLGFAAARTDKLDGVWTEALSRLTRGRGEAGRFAGSLDEDEEFRLALEQSDAPRLRAALDALLAPFEDADPASPDRYRVIAVLGSALTSLAASGHLDETAAHAALDFDDLRQAPGREFCLLARSRLPLITGALSRARRWSPSLTEAVEYLATHYGDALTLDSVADAVGVTPKRLSRHFIEELGQGFSDYLIDLRIGKAKILLSLPGVSIKQVSKECGYPDPNYFARLFKKVTGATPTEFSSQV